MSFIAPFFKVWDYVDTTRADAECGFSRYLFIAQVSYGWMMSGCGGCWLRTISQSFPFYCDQVLLHRKRFHN